MNESTLTQLKIVVERAVRPVGASASFKRKMREELLAHVIAVFKEESARLCDEQTPMQRTAERLGNPAELTGQLQGSVTAMDRLAQVLEFLFIGPGRSAAGLSLRFALITLFSAAPVLMAFRLQGRMAEWPTIIAWPVLMFFSVLNVDGLRDALFGRRGRSLRKAAIVSVASWLLIPGVIFSLCFTISGDVRSSLADVLPLLPLAVLTPAALFSLACAFAVDARTQQQWASLQID
jgi:hypothetical protein